MPTQVTLIKMSQINPGDHIEFSDYDFQYVYTRLKTPDDNDSRCILLQFKYPNTEYWLTNKGLLSDGFIAVKTSEVVQHIIENLNGTPTWFYRNVDGALVKSTFLLNNYQIDGVATLQSDRFLYKLLTGIDCDIQQVFNETLSFNVINGYAGNSALRLMFGVRKKFNEQLFVNNIFLLADHNIRLIHDTHLNVSISDVTDVMNIIATRVNDFKAITPSQTEHEAYAKILGSKIGKQYLLRVGALPENYSSLYYISFLLSSLVTNRNTLVEQQLVACMQKYHAMRQRN